MSIAMDRAGMRFARIDGRDVSVSVSNDDEARAAIRELRLKKRELALWKRGVLRDRKTVKARQAKSRRPRTMWQRLVQHKTGVFGWLMGFVRAYQARRPLRKLETLEHELEHIDDLAHRIDDCILQIEAKLLHAKR
ncbi:MAG: hypothetical protein RLZ98_2862 [Pseudomonadota bacterium]|jgi:hypothetical protein